MKKHFKKIVVNNEIVYANWFLRQAAALWDFVYFHILPIKTWQKLVDIGDKVKYAFERAFTGFDRRISWGVEYQIDFYKRMLSDLIKYSHGWPGTASTMEKICPLEWKDVKEKWEKRLPEGYCLDDIFFKDAFDENDIHEYSEDGFRCWKKYLVRVLGYFSEADYKTCSKNKRREELYSEMKPLFEDKSKRKIIECDNGEFFYQYPPLGDSEEDQKQIKILHELNDINSYQDEQLKLGMAEIAKNVFYLND